MEVVLQQMERDPMARERVISVSKALVHLVEVLLVRKEPLDTGPAVAKDLLNPCLRVERREQGAILERLAVSNHIPQPLGRVGTPEEAAGGILMLASPAAAYITGHVLEVTGGAGS